MKLAASSSHDKPQFLAYDIFLALGTAALYGSTLYPSIPVCVLPTRAALTAAIACAPHTTAGQGCARCAACTMSHQHTEMCSHCRAALQGGDSGELVAEACLGGVAHPPGYPLFIGLAKAFINALAWTGQSPAWRVNVMSASM